MTSLSSDPLSHPADTPTDIPTRSPRVAASTDPRVIRHLLTLTAALALGGIVVWQLRQEWAKETTWPWMLLLAAMFAGARALRGLELWLPGEPILPNLGLSCQATPNTGDALHRDRPVSHWLARLASVA